MTTKKFNWSMFSFTIFVLIFGMAIGYKSGKDMDNGIYRVVHKIVYEPILTETGVPCSRLGSFNSITQNITIDVYNRTWSEVMETCSHEYLHYKWYKGHFK